MNVKQLIEALQKLDDQDMLVFADTNGYDQEYCPLVERVEIAKFSKTVIKGSRCEVSEWSDDKEIAEAITGVMLR
jgi:hypothetical protein